MKKYLLLLFFCWCFGEDLSKEEALDLKIEALKEELKSFGVEPQSDLIEEKLKAKAQDFLKKNGFFLGISGGFVSLKHRYEDGRYNRFNNIEGAVDTKVLKSNIQSSTFLFLFGGKMGYQNFFNPYFGVRLYGDVFSGRGKQENLGKNFYVIGALNADLLNEYRINQAFDIGGFLGFGIGLVLFGDEAENTDSILLDKEFSSPNILWQNLLQVHYALNLGISVAYLKKHRFELATKIPISFLRLGLEKPAIYTNQTQQKSLNAQDIDFFPSISIALSYIYVF